ncbi:transcriptional regulator [Nitratireductor sp. ZSWI3]|uniref:transcriptional regulator n=1 Tax=Nitratireductor sp. ZSWI3 TaxID=2966359 RepID=UPI00214FF325|nr:transcriptional regulator [Nitratireductor sp. ZSWI3]MCR4266880.1 transcriptional regulator [Nitratireductor sp. ZSWI3]
MAREATKSAEQAPDKEEPLVSQYHAVGPAAVAAALQCKGEKPAPAPRPSPYTTQTD